MYLKSLGSWSLNIIERDHKLTTMDLQEKSGFFITLIQNFFHRLRGFFFI